MAKRNTPSHLEMRLIETFVAIAETGNFSIAARDLQRSPSAVSMQIKQLELALGGALFKRNSRSSSLTPKGEILLSFSRRILELNNKAIARCISPEMDGVVRIGVPVDFGCQILPNVMKQILGVFPNVKIDAVIVGKRERFDSADESELDIEIYDRLTDGEILDGQIVFREKLVWAGAKSGTAHLRDPLPISLPDVGCVWRDRLVHRLEEAGRPFRVAYVTNHPASATGAVRSDLVVGALPRFLVRGELKTLGEKDGLPDLGHYYVGLKVTARPSPLVSAVGNHLEAALQRYIWP